MLQSEDRKKAKVFESACGKVSKGFWKAKKETKNSRITKTILQKLCGGHRQAEKGKAQTAAKRHNEK